MSRKLYIGDWHYGHANVLAYDNRPFADVDDMNKQLCCMWKENVRPDDIVYILGDMFWCDAKYAIPVLEELPGQKFLIKGNHDRIHKSGYESQFVKITEYLEVEDEGNKIILCHYPIPCFKNHYRGYYHFYAHVHTSFEYQMIERFRYEMETLYDRPCNMFNVGAMMPWMNYVPRTFNEIVSGYTRYEASKELAYDKHEV